MSCRSLDIRYCQIHGDALHKSAFCVHCSNEGRTPPPPPPLKEPLAAWARKAIERFDSYKTPVKKPKAAHKKTGALTKREQQCADLYIQGMRVSEIAALLGKRCCSVSTWITRARRKRGFKTSGEMKVARSSCTG